MTAARKGTAEIGLAVMATTFTILAVFLPVGFMTGLVGQFFKSFALTVAFAVAMSLVIAFTLDPMLSSRFVRYVPPKSASARAWAGCWSAGASLRPARSPVFKVLRWALAHPFKVVAAALLVFAASLSTLSLIGTEFVPNEDRGEFVVMVDLPPGLAFDETVKSVSEVERAARHAGSPAGVHHGGRRRPDAQVTAPGAHHAKDERDIKLEDIKADLRTRLKRSRLRRSRSPIPSSCRGRLRAADQRVRARQRHGGLKRLSDELVARIRAIPAPWTWAPRSCRASRSWSRTSIAPARRPRLQRGIGGHAGAQHGGRTRAEQAARGGPRVRHPRASGARVPQRLHGAGGRADPCAGRRRGAHGRPGPDAARRGSELHRPRTARAAGQDRRRPAGTRPGRRHGRHPEVLDASSIPPTFQVGFAGDVE